MSNKQSSRPRLTDIDTAKGFAIFLVVLGHIVSGNGTPPANNHWYSVLQMGIYKFHMPFFMYLTGIVFAYTFPVINGITGYGNYVFGKLKRLSVGYIIFGLLIFMGKKSLSNVIHVDQIHDNVYAELYHLLVTPQDSAASSLWFIYVLMEMYVIFPLLIMLNIKDYILVVIGALLYFVPMPHIFLLDRLVEYILFFSIGIFVVRRYDAYMKWINRYFLVFLGLFVLGFLLIPYVSPATSKLFIGLSSLPALHALIRKRLFVKWRTLDTFGKYTYSIYLMNTIAIGIAKGLALLLLSWDGLNFLVVAPILLLSGIYMPIFAKRYIFARIPFLDRATT